MTGNLKSHKTFIWLQFHEMIRHYILPNAVFFQFNYNFWHFTAGLCTCHRFPRGGYPGLMWEKLGTLSGLFQQIWALVVGKCWELDLSLVWENLEQLANIWGLKNFKYSHECLLSQALQLQVKSILFRSGKWTVTIVCSRVLSLVRTDLEQSLKNS